MKTAGWVIVIVLVGVGLTEFLLVRFHHPTISQWMRHVSKAHRWFKWLVIGSATFLLYHWFWGPQSTFWDDPPMPPEAGQYVPLCGEDC